MINGDFGWRFQFRLRGQEVVLSPLCVRKFGDRAVVPCACLRGSIESGSVEGALLLHLEVLSVKVR